MASRGEVVAESLNPARGFAVQWGSGPTARLRSGRIFRDQIGRTVNSTFRLSQIEGFLDAGWTIAPGAWWDEGESAYLCGLDGCREDLSSSHPIGGILEPTFDTWPWEASPATTVLLVTGIGVDVVEVDQRKLRLNPGILAQLGEICPVALQDAAALPRLLIPVATPVLAECAAGSELGTGFARRTGLPGVGLHGPGSWVALPPARVPGGTTRWLTSPSSLGWDLPDLAFVMKVLASGALADVRHRVPAPQRVPVGKTLVGAAGRA